MGGGGGGGGGSKAPHLIVFPNSLNQINQTHYCRNTYIKYSMLINEWLDATVVSLLNMLGKTDGMLGKASQLIVSPNLFNKLNIARMLM